MENQVLSTSTNEEQEPAQDQPEDKVEQPAKEKKTRKKKVDATGADESIEGLRHEIQRLSDLVIEMGTHTGQANIIRSHGYPPLKYKKQDKYGGS